MQTMTVAVFGLIVLALTCGVSGASASGVGSLDPRVSAFIAERESETSLIDDDRRAALDELAAYVRGRIDRGAVPRLTFVCTHNSRRSHLAQVWAQTAAAHYGVAGVRAYSGGTEATAFNPRAVAALERAGFLVERLSEDRNPVYLVRWHADAAPMPCFSKVFSGAPNPTDGFAAVMVCDDADRACPVVPGAGARFSLPYVDPKAADGTPGEQDAYDERTRQLAREMLYLFSKVAG